MDASLSVRTVLPCSKAKLKDTVPSTMVWPDLV